MAWSFAQAEEISSDMANIKRVKVAIVKAAIAISSEADTVANHANRVAFANQILRAPGRWAEIMIVGVVTDATVQSSPNDANIYNAIAGQWDAYAGVSSG